MEKILIREVGLREGFQTLSKVFPVQTKIALLQSILETGIPEIELTSFVKKDRVPQLADAEIFCQQALQLPRPEHVSLTALYLNKKGFERAIGITGLSCKGWIPAAVSESFLVQNNNLTHAQLHGGIAEWISTFKAHRVPFRGVILSTCFGTSEEGIFTVAKIMRFVSQLVQTLAQSHAKITELSLADTEGIARPEQVCELLRTLKKEFPEITPSLHLHDTGGVAVQNATVGIEEGVRIFESSFGGFGGCPFAPRAIGNISTESIAALATKLGFETGVDLQKVQAVSALARKLLT